MPQRIARYRPPGTATRDAKDAARAYRGQEARQLGNRFYASAAWRKLRAAFLAEHPLCADCERRGRTTAAAHVHHVKPRKERPDLALDSDNLESLCQPCHNAKGRDGGDR